MVINEKVRTNVYLNKQTKQTAQEVLERYGVNLSDAINLFLSIIAEKKTLPFEFHIPNQTTRKAIHEVLSGQNVEEVTVEEVLSENKEA